MIYQCCGCKLAYPYGRWVVVRSEKSDVQIKQFYCFECFRENFSGRGSSKITEATLHSRQLALDS